MVLLVYSRWPMVAGWSQTLATRNINRYLETNMSWVKYKYLFKKWFTPSHCWWGSPSCWLWRKGGAASPRPRPSSPAPAAQSRCPAGGRGESQVKCGNLSPPAPSHAGSSLQAPPRHQPWSSPPSPRPSPSPPPASCQSPNQNQRRTNGPVPRGGW